MEPQRLQRDNEQRVASEHITVSLSVAVENASSGQVGPTLLMWKAKELMDQEGRGPVMKSQRHSLGKILGKGRDAVQQNHIK